MPDVTFGGMIAAFLLCAGGLIGAAWLLGLAGFAFWVWVVRTMGSAISDRKDGGV